jgi:ParB-like chromosome segregation protein Spo0J
MERKKNEIATLNPGLIKKNDILGLGVTAASAEKYRKLCQEYGNVCLAVVGREGDGYEILDGQDRLEGLASSGLAEMPVIVAGCEGEKEKTALALALSALGGTGAALCQGLLIGKLLGLGVARKELLAKLGKSKSWLSKRESVARRLEPGVRDMVRLGALGYKAAEEISRLPRDAQLGFAASAARDRLSKSAIGRVVGLYLDESTGDELRRLIVESPGRYDADMSGGGKGKPKEKLASLARHAARLTDEVSKKISAGELDPAGADTACVRKLEESAKNFLAVFKLAAAESFPGETGAEGTGRQSFPGETGAEGPGRESFPGETGAERNVR